MRGVGNFHPEWGYLVPMPSFKRAARIALVAAAIGAAAGAVAISALVAPSGSHAYSTIPVHALIASESIHASPAQDLTNTIAVGPAPATVRSTGVAANTEPPVTTSMQAATRSAVASAEKPSETALPAIVSASGPAVEASAQWPSAAAKSEPDVIHPKKSRIRAHHSRPASKIATHFRYERGFARSLEGLPKSKFVELDRNCCAWIATPLQRNAPEW
jgi:hypothetical protein